MFSKIRKRGDGSWVRLQGHKHQAQIDALCTVSLCRATSVPPGCFRL